MVPSYKNFFHCTLAFDEAQLFIMNEVSATGSISLNFGVAPRAGDRAQGCVAVKYGQKVYLVIYMYIV